MNTHLIESGPAAYASTRPSLNRGVRGMPDVDFEGGEKLLLAGLLTPRWDSFETFLVDYFDSRPRENGSAP